MAILPALPRFEVSICCGDQTLKEYSSSDDEGVGPRTVIKYVEAISGQAFRIKVKAAPYIMGGHDDLSLIIKLNGKWIDSHVLSAARWKNGFTICCDGPRYPRPDGTFVKQPMAFTELEIGDTDGLAVDAALLNKLQGLGSIEVKFYRVKTVGAGDQIVDTRLRDVGVVPEKALKGKAVSHTALCGQEILIQPFKVVKTTYVDPEDNPLALYKIHYRSMAALKSMLIVPRTPSPEPLEARAKRDPGSLTYDKLLPLQRRKNERETSSVQVKREIKRERTPSDTKLEDESSADRAGRSTSHKRHRTVD